MSSFDQVFCVTDQEKIEIEKYYNVSKIELKLMVKSLQKWVETQPHLPQDQDEYFYEMTLKLNKFNEEKARKKIENYYTIRHAEPDLYSEISAFSDGIKTFLDSFMMFPLPHLTPDLERIYLARIVDDDSTKFDMMSNAKILLTIFETRLRYDPAIGERYVVDLKGFNFGHLFKASPKIIKKINTIMTKAYSDKLKGVHLLNLPAIGHTLVNILKLVLNQKLANRVFSHKNIESLSDIIPKNVLPSDYNGKLGSSEELYKPWRKCLEDSDPWLLELANKKSNEELRLTSKNGSYFSSFFNIFGN